MPKKMLLDCDPGIDDALALAVAHGSPEVDLVGITTVAGNVGVDNTTDNALRLVDYYGMKDVPIARGAGVPIVRPPRVAADIHGATGLGDAVLPESRTRTVSQHAIDLIIDTLAASPGEISLVAVGPLTNIALALRKEPRITEWVREFVVMGGSYTRGNTTPAAEFNILADPEAAAIAISAPWQPILIGLDLTLQSRVTSAVWPRFADLGRLESELLTPCLGFYGSSWQYADKGPAIHDACAVAYVIAPELIETTAARVEVETEGRFTSGMTVTDFPPLSEPPNAEVATQLDADGFWDLVERCFRSVAATLP